MSIFLPQIPQSFTTIPYYELHNFHTNYSVFINIQLWRWYKNCKFFSLDCLHFLLKTSEKSLYCVMYLCIVHIWSTTAILTQILVLCMRSVMHKWLLLPSGYLSINIPNKIGNIKATLMKDTQPIRLIFGGPFCLCTTSPQKRLDFRYPIGKK